MAKVKIEAIEEATKNLKILMKLSTHISLNIYLSLFTFVHATFVLVLLIYSVYHFWNSLEELSQVVFNISFILSVMVGCYTGCSPNYNNRLIIDDSCFTYDYQSSLMKKKLDEVKGNSAKTLKRFQKIILISIVLVSSNFAGVAILVGLIKQRPIYIFPIWHPFDMNNLFVQILILLWQQYVIFTMIFMAFGGGTALFVPYNYIKAEVALLNHALREIEPRAQEMANKRYDSHGHLDRNKVLSACYKECLNMCVEHHIEILRYFSIVKDMVGLSYTAAFCSGIVACSFGAYNITSDNLEVKLKMGISFFILGYLSVMFWIGDETSIDMLTIADEVFAMEWYNLPKECQSTLQVLLLMSNQPVFYKMVLGQRVDMEAYSALVKATYYYLNILTA